jgi:hypothetical protein
MFSQPRLVTMRRILQLAHFTAHELPGTLAILVAGICIGFGLAAAWLRRSD